MIQQLEQIANEIANSRVRLSNPFMGKQTRQDIIDEGKRMEYIEVNLRRTISDLKDKLDELRGSRIISHNGSRIYLGWVYENENFKLRRNEIKKTEL